MQASLNLAVADGAPGALLRVEATDWEWSGSAGALDRDGREALRPEAPFRAASVTKTVTATTVLALAEQGVLALDRQVGEVLPRATLALLPDAWGATPRHLIGHTSGLPDYFYSSQLPERLATNPTLPFEPVDLLRLAASVGPPAFAPGAGFAYSDTGYVLAGLVVEQVTGMPLHGAYRQFVFDPLGMDATYLEGHEPARGGRPACNLWGERDMSGVTPTFDWAGGGLVTTSSDLAAFVRGLWSGRLLARESLDTMTSWNRRARFPPDGTPQYEHYGLGIGSNTVAGVELIGHTGFWGSFAYWAPAHAAALTGTVNSSGADRAPLVEAACRALREQPAAVDSPPDGE
jgi:D-alanyl-D-alanine carboxypeptidase